MKKTLAILIALTMLFAFSGIAMAGTLDANGAHYSLNIIGVQNPKTADMDGSNGHVIFVPLSGKAKINLIEGDDFAVIDANATDNDGAEFQLPDPGYDPYVIGGDMTGVDTTSDYSIFVRPLGKPGGWSTITTCADIVNSALADFLSADTVKVLNKAADLGGFASVEQVGQDITFRDKGQTKFENVTAELTSIVLKVEYSVDGATYTDYVRVPIFDSMLENEYWEYDNHGLKLLQVRFYQGYETDVTESDINWNSL